MEGWTQLKDCVENGEGGFYTDLDNRFSIEDCKFDPAKERLRSLFDQLLVSFIRGKSVNKCIKPIPALCGDGQLVDLFKLFWVVRRVGDYDTVCRKKLWGFVSEQCQLGFRLIPSIKLIYSKYLKEFDQWLRQGFTAVSFEDKKSEVIQKLDSLAQELETKFRIVLEIGQAEPEYDFKSMKHTKYKNDIILATAEREIGISPIRGIREDRTPIFNGRVSEISVDYDNHQSADKIMLETGSNAGTNDIFYVPLNDSGISEVEDNDNFLESDQKVVNNVHNCESRAITDQNRYPLEDNTDLVLSKQVVEKVLTEEYDLPQNIIAKEKRLNTLKGLENLVSWKNLTGNVQNSLKRKREFQSLPKGSEDMATRSVKRKHDFQSLKEMLYWLTRVSKKPDNPAIGSLPECSNWKNHGNEELWVQVLLFRKALLIRRHTDANGCETLLKSQSKKSRMHPFMYEDDALRHQSMDRVRSSGRIPSLAKPPLCTCCNSSASHQSRIAAHQKAKATESRKESMKPVSRNVEEPDIKCKNSKSSDMPFEKHVSVGPRFQAVVPEWTGKHLESDSKWLGTRMWPLENFDDKSGAWLDPVGKGRLQDCSCLFPNSVECARFHIAEKRFNLRRDIGLLFFRWGFDRMGEEVSLSWTTEEESKFKDMMRLYAALPNKFWNNAHKFLPFKTREKMVSFYFNVFLIRRRSYQNRVTPKELDSDDDEKECGQLGNSFGYKSLNTPSSTPATCTENMDSTELVEYAS